MCSKERQRPGDAKEKGETAVASKIVATDDDDINGRTEEPKDREDMLMKPAAEKVPKKGKKKVSAKQMAREQVSGQI